jgi:hypothetical protein
MLCSNATILRARSDPRWDIAGVMQPSENLKKLDGSYLTLPPEALIFRKMGANVFMDAGGLARAQWFWEQRPKKLVLSTERALGILIFYGSFWLVATCLDLQADKLDKYFHRITSCLVIVEAPSRHAASHFTSASNSECRARNSASRMSRR